ncbi:MAG TPA: ATP-binding cassette domain-containing protein [Bryobacteraceae bacterium]|nr:ATP-binding cassette domain-containing protein [Bryobacteraceae bacterium]
MTNTAFNERFDIAKNLLSPEGVPAIEVHDLVKTYPNQVRALDGLSFSVEAGTIFALLGPNGAGKSTTVKILNTLSRPDSGSAKVAGIDVLREPDRVRRAIGCVAQKSGVDTEATGRENLTLQARIYGLRGRAMKDRVSELLERFGLTKAADLVARTYSGGMQRKLDIAMGLVHQPRVLFLDEPTTGLDPEARSDLWEEVSRLAHGDGITVLLTTHYLEEADKLAKRLAIVDRGRLAAEGTPEGLKGELFGDAIHIDLVEAADDARIRAALERLDGIRDVATEGCTIRARADQGATAVPAMLAALEIEGVKAVSVRVARPSLDDVYLRHTGRSFTEAERANETKQGGSR